MRSTLVAAAMTSLLSTALAGDAPVVKDNEEYSVHHADLIHKVNSTIFGGITITATPESSALHVDVHIGGIPEGQYISTLPPTHPNLLTPYSQFHFLTA